MHLFARVVVVCVSIHRPSTQGPASYSLQPRKSQHADIYGCEKEKGLIFFFKMNTWIIYNTRPSHIFRFSEEQRGCREIACLDAAQRIRVAKDNCLRKHALVMIDLPYYAHTHCAFACLGVHMWGEGIQVA